MPPKPRSGKTFEPFREALAHLARVGQLGFLVAGGALAGFGLGYAAEALGAGRAGRVVGLVVGVAGGLWAAGRDLIRVINQGDKDP